MRLAGSPLWGWCPGLLRMFIIWYTMKAYKVTLGQNPWEPYSSRGTVLIKFFSDSLRTIWLFNVSGTVQMTSVQCGSCWCNKGLSDLCIPRGNESGHVKEEFFFGWGTFKKMRPRHFPSASTNCPLQWGNCWLISGARIFNCQPSAAVVTGLPGGPSSLSGACVTITGDKETDV